MIDIAEKSLRMWPLSDPKCEFHAHRENTVFRVSTPTGDYALRLHRENYRTDDELASELAWMAAVSAGGVCVPTPLMSKSGAYLEIVDGVQVDMLHWLAGQNLVEHLDGTPEKRMNTIRLVARETAKFHDVCDKWVRPDGFDRPDWDIAGLVGDTPVWGRFWENPALSDADAEFFSRFREIAHNQLCALQDTLDYGLIHADLLRENVLIDGDSVRFIDFDDGGFGFRLFELSTALIRLIDDPDFEDLKQAAFQEYTRIRPLETGAFDLFLALRATTYVGWIADRPDLPDAAQRQETNAKIARNLVQRYLDQF